MQEFIREKNRELFLKKLSEATDESERRRVTELLAELEARDKPVRKSPDEG
jgi:hypothetical protein